MISTLLITMNETAASESDMMLCCASCGIVGGDDIKLMDCGGCDLVKYCSDACQEDNRPRHEEECKKREAELYDELLFRQPEGNYYGDCPICRVPLSIDTSKSMLSSCCSKIICKGCDYTMQLRELEGGLRNKCPFCPTDMPDTEEAVNEQVMKRVESNDPVAMRYMGMKRYDEGDYNAAFRILDKGS